MLDRELECVDPTFKMPVFEAAHRIELGLVNLSYYKYGPCRDNFGGGRVDALGSAELCIEKFKKTHNQEYLHDAMNYLLFRVMFPMPGDFMEHTDSEESAGTVGTPKNLEKEL